MAGGDDVLFERQLNTKDTKYSKEEQLNLSVLSVPHSGPGTKGRG